MREKSSGQIFVIKFIPINLGDPGDLNNKLGECTVLRNLNHPNICRI